MLAPKTVNLLGHDVPAYDQMLTGEVVELERLALRTKGEGLSAVEQNYETARILLHYRAGETLSPLDLTKPAAFDFAELEEAVVELCAPFFELQRKRAQNKRMRALDALSAPALQAQIAHTESILVEMKRTLRRRQRGGGAA